MKNKHKVLLTVLAGLMFLSFHSQGQVYISGPDCAVASVEYQYNISATWADSSSIEVCLSGGHIAGSENTCYNGAPVSFVRVVWNDTTAGSVNVSSSIGNAIQAVTLTTVLEAGQIDSLSRFQGVPQDSLPLMISCSTAKGGNCYPSYRYQWQQSPDNQGWEDIADATGQHLSFQSPLSQTTYYRRKVTETASHSVQYSDVAIVIVQP